MPSVLELNRNCGHLLNATRFALLVDGSNYYAALAQAMGEAKHTIVIVGWDLDTRTRLGPGAGDGQLEPPIREFFPALAERHPDLNIYILSWSFPLLFANVRDPKLVWGRDPFNHPRVHLEFDGSHPAGGSHHQKIVVIDDCLAFAGGMDIAGGRWDTPEHRARDPRRAGKDEPYPPSHDVQAVVDGEAAGALAGIVRDRWHRATGTSIPVSTHPRNIWPARVTPDLVDVTIAISRTDVDAEGRGRREVEQLHLDLIETAREHLYIENQYLTSATIVAALCRRLQTPEGPETVLVLPLNNTGWLEERTIEVLRFQSVRRLRDADRFARLSICYPVVPALDGQSVAVHSKILVADDRVFRVGSSNITNRSMGLDTECDLTIEASRPSERFAIAALRNSLLAEHLGMPVAAVESFLSKDGSLLRLIDSRRTESRCLRELPAEDRSSELLLDDDLVDPSGPLTPHAVIEALASSVAGRRFTRGLPLVLIAGAATIAAVALWGIVKATSPPPKR